MGRKRGRADFVVVSDIDLFSGVFMRLSSLKAHEGDQKATMKRPRASGNHKQHKMSERHVTQLLSIQWFLCIALVPSISVLWFPTPFDDIHHDS